MTRNQFINYNHWVCQSLMPHCVLIRIDLCTIEWWNCVLRHRLRARKTYDSAADNVWRNETRSIAGINNWLGLKVKNMFVILLHEKTVFNGFSLVFTIQPWKLAMVDYSWGTIAHEKTIYVLKHVHDTGLLKRSAFHEHTISRSIIPR